MGMRNRKTTANGKFALGGVSYSTDSLVVAVSFVLPIKFSGKIPAHRKSAKLYTPFYPPGQLHYKQHYSVKTK